MKLQTRGMRRDFGGFSFDADIAVDEGEFVCLLGPSGCGKTTALQLIAGILAPDTGAIRLGDRDITTVPPWQRNIGLVFQDYALFPNMSVHDNVAYGLKQKAWPREKITHRVKELLDLVRLPDHGSRRPENLSGGEKQRIALARAIAPSPDLLLLDEPLSALDAGLRLFLRREIRRIQRRVGLTTIYVTHDQEEALSLADRIIVMKDGRIVQQGGPQDLYHNPAGSFVARFMGKVNLLPVSGESSAAVAADVEASGSTGTRGYYFFRPEDTILSRTRPGSQDFFSVPMTISTVEYVGSHYIVEGGKNGNSLRAYISEKDFQGLTIRAGDSECWFSVDRGSMKVISE